jgi:hypothetical protein
MPVGVPAEAERGDREVGVGADGDAPISRVAASASSGRPPTNWTIAGAAAIAKPPKPAVSVIVESPMSGLASAAEAGEVEAVGAAPAR